MKDIHFANMKVKEAAQQEKNIEESAQEEYSTGQLRIFKNLLILCLGFFVLYLPFESLASLQSTLNADNNIGVISQAVIYAASMLSSLLLPKLVIEKLGCKNALVLCILTFFPYFAANFYPHMATFIPTAILLGIANGPLWAAKCAFLNEISALYAVLSKNKADAITSRFMGIFYMVFQTTHIWGNLVSYYMLKTDTPNEDIFSNTSSNGSVKPYFGVIRNLSCGAQFCGGMNKNLLPPSQDKTYMLNGVYVCCVLMSGLIVFMFLDPLSRNSDDRQSKSKFYSRAIATLRHLRNRDQQFLIPLTIFNGIEQAFLLGDYSKAFVGCALGVHNICLVFIFYGVVNSVSSFMSGHLIKYIPRVALMLTAAAGNIGVCSVLLLWQPSRNEYAYFFILIGLWGISDGIWMTQINAAYCIIFRGEEEAAFGNYRLWVCIGFSLSFGYSAYLCVADKIYILLVFLIMGITGYVTLEVRRCTPGKMYSVSETS